MKKLMIIVLASLFGLGYVQAQQVDSQETGTVVTRSGKKLKGPQAKNRKVWENKQAKKQSIVTASSDEKLQGPRAKNKKPFAERSDVTYKEVQVNTSRKGLKGPKAKNYRPIWKKKNKQSKDSKDQKMDQVTTK